MVSPFISSDNKVYAIADLLGITIEAKDGILNGNAKKTVELGPDFKISVPVMIVSSLYEEYDDKETAVLVRVIGNLLLLVCPYYDEDNVCHIFVVDAAKMKSGTAENYLETKNFKKARDAVEDLKEAIVHTLHLTAVKNEWISEAA